MQIDELTFDRLSEVNAERAQWWHKGFGYMTGDWTGSDWSNAAAGEMGEACNIVKKLRRAETGHISKADPPPAKLSAALAEEIADVVIYLDLLATYYGLDIAQAVTNKFNKVSDREGAPQFKL